MLMGWIYSLKPQIYIVFVISIIGMIVVLILIFYGNLLGMIVVMGNASDPHRLGAGIHWLHRDKLQPLALCPCLSCGRPNGGQLPSDHLPLL